MPKNLYLRNGIYWARFKVRGTEYRESLRTRVERVAEKRCKALIEEIENQVVFSIAGPITWPSAVVTWNEKIAGELGARTLDRYATSLRQWRGHLDDKHVHEVTTDLVKDIIKERRRAGATNATIRRDLTAITSVLNVAVDEGWIPENPVDAINRRRLVPEKTVPIVLPTEAAMAATRARLPSRMWDIFEMTRETGMRLDEVVSLKHSAIDRRGRTITLRGKRNKVRTLPLSAAAEAIIDRQPRFIKKPLVFWRGEGEAIADISSRTTRYMKRMAQKAAQAGDEFEPFSHHDMRHLFAVEYLRLGRGSIYDLQGELGHDSISTTERYLDFLTPDQAKAAKQGVAQFGSHDLRFSTPEI